MAQKRKAPVRKAASTSAARMNVLLEQIQDQVRGVAEGQIGLRAEMERRFDETERRINARLETLELAVRNLGGRIGALEDKVTALEKRLDLVEQRLDRVEQRLDQVEKNVVEIRQELHVLATEQRDLSGRVDSYAATRAQDAQAIAGLQARVGRLERHMSLE
jgi:chromosome segregation ATPase